ncbi:hypothetical protein [Micromonospora fulviviridis]|uniref:Uncharacterized protein n=1 Tax=Micromonospora fulviviridis TaxID=47860 RepID=A0ABV2VGS3_9ACTN
MPWETPHEVSAVAAAETYAAVDDPKDGRRCDDDLPVIRLPR